MTDEPESKVGIGRLALICVLLLTVLVVYGLVKTMDNHEKLLEISTKQHEVDLSFKERLDRLER